MSSGLRLEDHLELEVLLQAVRVLAVAAVGRAAATARRRRRSTARARGAQQRRRVERAGADLGVVRRHDQAAVVGPVAGQACDHILEACPRHVAAVYPGRDADRLTGGPTWRE